MTADTPTMRAVTQDRYGSSDVLHLTQAPVPSVGAEEILVHVHAAGLDRGTEHLMTGKPYAVRLAVGRVDPRSQSRATTSPGLSQRSVRR